MLIASMERPFEFQWSVLQLSRCMKMCSIHTDYYMRKSWDILNLQNCMVLRAFNQLQWESPLNVSGGQKICTWYGWPYTQANSNKLMAFNCAHKMAVYEGSMTFCLSIFLLLFFPTDLLCSRSKYNASTINYLLKLLVSFSTLQPKIYIFLSDIKKKIMHQKVTGQASFTKL